MKTVNVRYRVMRYGIPALTALLFIGLFVFAIMRLLHESKVVSGDLMAHDIVQLALIFKKIDENCKIIGFEHERNYIDFLNVKSFAGSLVGSMNLAYPHQWKGEYVPDNPTMQDKFYEIVKAKEGYFIVPGQGVTLANGKVMGQDIVITSETAITPLLQDEQALNYKGQALGAPVPMSGNAFHLVVQEAPLRVSKEEVQQVHTTESIAVVC